MYVLRRAKQEPLINHGISHQIKTRTWLSITSQKLRMKSQVHSPIAFRRLKEHGLLENLGGTIEY